MIKISKTISSVPVKCNFALIPHLLLRHSTCPVCRQTLAIGEEEVEEEVGYDGGDESEEGE